MSECANCGAVFPEANAIVRHYGKGRFQFLFCDNECASGWDKKEQAELRWHNEKDG